MVCLPLIANETSSYYDSTQPATLAALYIIGWRLNAPMSKTGPVCPTRNGGEPSHQTRRQLVKVAPIHCQGWAIMAQGQDHVPGWIALQAKLSLY